MNPNPDTGERVRQIRQRLVAHKTEAAMYRNHEWARGDALHYREAPSDVDYLLSLLDSQVATRHEPYSEACRAAIDALERRFESEGVELCSIEYARQRENHAATRMREACVDAIKTLRATPHGAAYNNAINDAIHKVESLTLEQGEQEKLK